MKRYLFAALTLLVANAPVTAQDTPDRPHNVTLDVTALGGSLYYAQRTGPGVSYGFGGGVGGDFLSAMVIGGRHFGEACCITYEDRDAADNELLFEILHLDAFRRTVVSERLEYDIGLRASAFFHGDDSDDELGGGLFGGLHGGIYYGWRNLKIGPQVLVGVFGEQNDPQQPWLKEFGVLLTPISIRTSFSW